MSKTKDRIQHDYKDDVVQKFERASEIAEEIDNEDLSNFDEYNKIVDTLEKDVGFKDANKIIQKW